MNKSPINYVLTAVIGATLWVIFAIFLASYFSENPSLAEKYPEDLAVELRLIFGAGTLLSIIFAGYWYYYGSQEKVAGQLPAAKTKWRTLFFMQVLIAVALAFAIVIRNRNEGIESQWFVIYFLVLSLLTFTLFWITTFLFSPRTVKFVPFGK
ncbi:hypothetical protein LXM25_16180 [Dyadobacter sp. LJ53]|uniref:hypothetical protein n=1 Tax=Dyadobacter chenwenxiniae TaxID=2906456 RepID=UPI001F348AD6|nr:hypothetical protein [Dyadobacter chenwenxiniae]MCF0051607.1 hypothetical protein [Dyadobacter chenwenxiniae]